ncbi:SseB family protein [Actinoallomurus bryophytorum]|uniref:Type III secretion system (T3SS) SseB-like protein n=1 Tax=Actinoallomurus bryophytorum TaxID=1490222 RepID=A0A543CBX5_9ACTN|nr:SseB family protein [Actinoallomurus bryophytorum]TQL94569.1 type III secretion system (T3SS) SseB-like protein [Actinoallomurus bryophytorum]
MSGRSIPQPEFPDDDGSAAAELEAALRAYAEGTGGEHAVLAALSGARLLVPVVAILTEDETVDGLRREKESEMALPTLVGDDGRKAVLAFTSTGGLARWRPDARPVAVRTAQACRAALDEPADAVVIDIAGPVPYAIEGARLRVLAEGGAITAPHEDPHVLAAVHAAVGDLPGVTGVQAGPGERGALAVRLRLAEGADDQAVLRAAATRLSEHLRGHVDGGVELGLVSG